MKTNTASFSTTSTPEWSTEFSVTQDQKTEGDVSLSCLLSNVVSYKINIKKINANGFWDQHKLNDEWKKIILDD